MRVTLLGLATCVILSCLAATARAEPTAGHSVNSLGRWIGYGWSHGYHAQDGCDSAGCANAPPIMQRDEHSYPVLEHSVPAPATTPTAPKSTESLPLPQKSVLPRKTYFQPGNEARYQRPFSPLRSARYPLDAAASTQR